VLFGQIDEVEGSTVRILGRDFDLAGVNVSGNDLARYIGKTAYIEAVVQTGGAVATRLFVVDQISVPGATQVLVAGTVETAQSNIGQVKVSGVTVDINQLSGIVTQPGSQLFVWGIQPIPGGVVLATGLAE
jgi:hypothetical protein